MFISSGLRGLGFRVWGSWGVGVRGFLFLGPNLFNLLEIPRSPKQAQKGGVCLNYALLKAWVLPMVPRVNLITNEVNKIKDVNCNEFYFIFYLLPFLL